MRLFYQGDLPIATCRPQAQKVLEVSDLVNAKCRSAGCWGKQAEVRVSATGNGLTGGTYLAAFTRFIGTQDSLGQRQGCSLFADS